MNATKHGIYAESLLLPTENPQELEQLRRYYYHRFQPADQPEADLVETMISSMWRLRRIARIDTGLLLQEFKGARKAASRFSRLTPEQQESFTALRHLNLNSNAVSALDRQESKLYRHFSRAMNDLIKLRKNFPVPEDDAPTPIEKSPESSDERNEPATPANVISINANPGREVGLSPDGRRLTPLKRRGSFSVLRRAA
ncbi:MAG: hypothetical protein SFV51_18055 [Bryobacteraceae bacterium]|nr:hypothetical protein [Bryobacteraceae bacterium]